MKGERAMTRNMPWANYKGVHGRTRIIALIIFICLIFISYSAEAYILANAHHDCAGNDCPVCEHIQKAIALDVLIDKIINVAVIPLIMTAWLFLATIVCDKSNIYLLVPTSVTLIEAKVRMNN